MGVPRLLPQAPVGGWICQKPRFSQRAGFTVMELATVIVVLSILLVLFLPAIGLYRGRSERLNCTTNLRSLYVAASQYTTDNLHWPQIATHREHRPQAEAWHATLRPYGLDWINWACPTVQRQAGNPDFKDPKNHRVDYFATPFDDKPRTPWRWATQPWFIERGDVHGRGNLMVFRDGSIEDMRSVARRVSMQGGTLD